MEKIYHCRMNSPIGELSVFATDTHLRKISWLPDTEREDFAKRKKNEWQILWEESNEIINAACDQLNRYFTKKLQKFSLPIALQGTTFQISAWTVLQQIPFGRAISYKEQALKAGRPKAIRAIGSANHQNPVPVIIPCHRVVQKNGKLGGYAGGLDKKDWLLQHEGIIL